MSSFDNEDQSNEQLALAEICGPDEFQVLEPELLQDSLATDCSFTRAGRLKARPDLGDSELSVRYSPEGLFTVKYLPPISLEFLLPDDYPSLKSPIFKLYAEWLNKYQIEQLTERLKLLWTENSGCVILFTWLSFLKEESLQFLKIEKLLDISRVIQEKEPQKPEHSSPISESRQKSTLEKSGFVLVDEDDGKIVDGANGFTHPDLHIQGSWQTRDGESKKSETKGTPIRKETERKSCRTNLKTGGNGVVAEENVEDERMRSEKLTKKKPSEKYRTTTTKNQEVLSPSVQDVVATDSSHDNRRPRRSGHGKNSDKGYNKSPRGSGINSHGDEPVRNKNGSRGRIKSHRQKDVVERQNFTVKDFPDDDTKTTSSDTSNVSPSKSNMSGVVVRWFEDRGFGFIRESDSSTEHYFHITNFMGESQQLGKKGSGLRVVFYLGIPNKGRCSVQALDVRPYVVGDEDDLQHSTSEEKGVIANDTCCTKPAVTNSDLEPSDECAEKKIGRPTFDLSRQTKNDDHDFKGLQPSKNLELITTKPLSGNLENSTLVKKNDETILSVIEPKSIPWLVKLLKDFNSEQEDRNFDVSVFPCNVCFAEKMGSQSIRFPDCHHVYCKECMAGYFEVQIKEGMVSSLTCPEDKCNSQALPTQVKNLVPDSLYTRYESQLLATTLETMSDVLLCPRLKCQCPTVIDRDASMGECPNCHFAFCIYCKAAFHGVAACRIKSQEHRALVTEYMGASDEHKLTMEKRYSKKQLISMMNMMLSENYLTDNTKPCPKCQAPIQKTEGCNKMTCNKCNTHFCYLCGSKLPLENPYSHFSLMGSECFNRLFQGVDMDDPDMDDPEFLFPEDDDEDNDLDFMAVL